MSDYPSCILAVDDDPTLRAFAETELAIEGSTVLTAEDGLDALAKLDAQPVDVVVLDLEMPKMGGIEFLERLRQSPDHAKLPVVVLTSRFEAEVIDAAFKAGATAYAMKPVDWNRLRQRLREVCR